MEIINGQTAINFDGWKDHFNEGMWGHTSPSLNSNIICNYSEDTSPRLKIFYESNEMIMDKIELLQEKGFDFNGRIEFVESGQYGDPKLDLSKSKITNLYDDNCQWENGLRYVVFEYDRITVTESYNTGDECSSFILNKISLLFIDQLYQFSYFGWDSPTKFEATPKFPYYYCYGPVTFHFELSFWARDSEKEEDWIFRRNPKLRIKTDNTDQDLLQNLADHICLLTSYYFNTSIDYYHASIRGNGETTIIGKKISEFPNMIKPKTKIDKFENVYEFIGHCDYKRIEENYPFIKSLLQRTILVDTLNDESKFMILYNLIEQIRNYYVNKHKDSKNPIKVKEEYSFTLGKKKTDSTISDTLKTLTQYIAQDEQEDFNSEASGKVNGVKLYTMKNQFQSFFEFKKITPADYSLDMTELFGIRNKIFHGQIINVKELGIIAHNVNMRILLDKLIVDLLTEHQ